MLESVNFEVPRWWRGRLELIEEEGRFIERMIFTYDWAYNSDEGIREKIRKFITNEVNFGFCCPQTGRGKTHMALEASLFLSRSRLHIGFVRYDLFANLARRSSGWFDNALAALCSKSVIVIDEINGLPENAETLRATIGYLFDRDKPIIWTAPMTIAEMKEAIDGSVLRRLGEPIELKPGKRWKEQ